MQYVATNELLSLQALTLVDGVAAAAEPPLGAPTLAVLNSLAKNFWGGASGPGFTAAARKQLTIATGLHDRTVRRALTELQQRNLIAPVGAHRSEYTAVANARGPKPNAYSFTNEFFRVGLAGLTNNDARPFPVTPTAISKIRALTLRAVDGESLTTVGDLLNGSTPTENAPVSASSAEDAPELPEPTSMPSDDDLTPPDDPALLPPDDYESTPSTGDIAKDSHATPTENLNESQDEVNPVTVPESVSHATRAPLSSEDEGVLTTAVTLSANLWGEQEANALKEHPDAGEVVAQIHAVLAPHSPSSTSDVERLLGEVFEAADDRMTGVLTPENIVDRMKNFILNPTYARQSLKSLQKRDTSISTESTVWNQQEDEPKFDPWAAKWEAAMVGVELESDDDEERKSP